MKKIYYLYHVRYEDTDDEDVKIIGIYSSRKQAKLAIERMKKKPGFEMICTNLLVMGTKQLVKIGFYTLDLFVF